MSYHMYNFLWKNIWRSFISVFDFFGKYGGNCVYIIDSWKKSYNFIFQHGKSTLVYRIDVHARLLILKINPPCTALVCMFIVFEKKFPLHVYSILHVYWYLPCTFINFEKKNPPCTALFWSARLLFLRKNSPCMFIFLHFYCYLPCTFINFEKKIPPARPYLGLHV